MGASWEGLKPHQSSVLGVALSGALPTGGFPIPGAHAPGYSMPPFGLKETALPLAQGHIEDKARLRPPPRRSPTKRRPSSAWESLRGPSRGHCISQRAFASGIAPRRASKTLFTPPKDFWGRRKSQLTAAKDFSD